MDQKRKKRLIWQIPFLTLLIVGTVIIIKQQRTTPYHCDEGIIFGTTYRVTYQYGDDLKKEIEEQMNKVDRSLSMFNGESVIAQVNQGHNVIGNTDEDKMFIEVFRLAKKISEQTDGAFDITVAPLVNAWGFGFKTKELPTAHEVDSMLHFIGFNKIDYDSITRTITKTDERIMLDCSAIAKGYGSDVVARFLKSKGVENYMVEIGGEVVTRGISPKRLPWRIGVTKPSQIKRQTKDKSDEPVAPTNEIQTVLNVTDKAMATSGNYRNYYYHKGKRYAHTIDPKTGYPVQHSLLSATVLAPECAMADAYATAFMVMGVDQAKTVLGHHPELMAYFIYADDEGNNAVWFSNGLKPEN